MDPYKILDLDKSASQEDIKKAYQKAAKKNHPDSPERDEDRWDEVSKAYEILSDPGKRRIYDETGFHADDHDELVSSTTAAVFLRHMNCQDPLRESIKTIERENNSNTLSIFENKVGVSRIDTLLKRLSRNDGNERDPIRSALEGRKIELENRIKSATYVISLMKEVIGELKKYSLKDATISQTDMLMLKHP